ncbi:MAG: tRNA (N6-isopentenyl adenosine(37)-C2)-methylthiotransferase MiaB [Chloroflexota bacterium]|nr:tRNA (N6-isopentenyl adenosine(37)-C2)-methylthiotransferase MiaB [Chloroflexota bacterium]
MGSNPIPSAADLVIMIKNYHIWTIGCQMNMADSERLESAMSQMGLTNVQTPKDADVIVLNSCVVRQSAEDKAVGMLTSLKPLKQRDPSKIIALMGCMVGPKTETLENKYPYADLFMPPQQFEPLIELLGERMKIDPEGCIGPLVAKPDVTAYIPISHGCDKMCAFCIIPYRRGRDVSRDIDDVVRETELLVARGVKEVTLLGQNVDSYGHDLMGTPDLSDLLTKINEIQGLQRIRFLTSHPNDMTERIIDSVSSLDKVCEHFNLPFQAGDDEILTRMRRGYTNNEYRKLVDKIRELVPNVSISTDIIVGFSGESESQFEKTLELVRDIKFDKVHVAAYSDRPGTIASRTMEDDVSDEDKQSRLKAIETLQEEVVSKINSQLSNEKVEVLVEGQKRGKWFGRNRNDKLVFFESTDDRTGEMLNVRVKKTGPWSLQGALVS